MMVTAIIIILAILINRCAVKRKTSHAAALERRLDVAEMTMAAQRVLND
jgi:hypothetical protein